MNPGRQADRHAIVAPKVLFVQPSLDPPGGANGVAAWMVQALAGEWRCTLLTLESPDLMAVDRFYGTSLSGATLDCRLAAPRLHASLRRIPMRLASLKSALLFAAARRISTEFDLVLTANGEADLGVPAIQYVHYPARLYPRPDADHRWFHLAWLLRLYRVLCARIQPAPLQAIAGNLTLVNSAWCGAKMREAYGFTGDVVYPAVVWTGADAHGSHVNWASSPSAACRRKRNSKKSSVSWQGCVRPAMRCTCT